MLNTRYLESPLSELSYAYLSSILLYQYYRNMKVNGILRVEVPSMEEDSIKDTIGAGDSFIAGFLHSVAYTEEGQTSGLKGAIENGVGTLPLHALCLTFSSLFYFSYRYRLLKA